MDFKSAISNFFERLFFNPKWKCIVCGREIFEEGYLCEHCKKEMPYNNGAICGHCGRAVVAFEPYCTTCKNVLVALDLCRSCFVYAPPISNLIQKAKYENARYLLDYFAQMLALEYSKNFFRADYLTFVPMTEKAYRDRGYNQSQILAEKLSERIGVPMLDCIKKVKDTKRQATLGRADRLKNLSEAFRVIDKSAVKGKSIMIIDDVSTTGATAQVIAERLKIAGAKQVFLLTVASTPPLDKY